MDDLQLEHSFLKAPCESLAKTFRDRQKRVHKDLASLASATASLGQTPTPAALSAAVARLAALHQTLASTRASEATATSHCTDRVSHLASRPAVTRGAPSNSWDKTRLDRLLVDYLLRRGMGAPAALLASSECVEALVERAIFEESRVIVADLSSRTCNLALAWCSENRRRLARVNSDLEFRLRLQEFVELARNGQKRDAIVYVRAHLTGSQAHMGDVQRAMALLAFGPNHDCQPYKNMYAVERWDELVDAFLLDNYRIHGLPKESLLETTLKAGLSALKTTYCGSEEHSNPHCPTCTEPYAELAQDLPRARHVHSVLVCLLSKSIMDENNNPMVLPNGNVYGQSALVHMSQDEEVSKAKGTIIDPKTQQRYDMSELRRAFIM